MSSPEVGDKAFTSEFLQQDRRAGGNYTDRDVAFNDFDQGVTNSTDFLRFVTAADEQMLAGTHDQARRLYFAALKEPHMEGSVLFNVYKNLGNISMHEGDLDGAEEYYNKAYTMNPDSDVLMVNFGSLAVQRRQLDMAVRRFRRAVELNGKNEKGWMGLALVHREFGDAELAWANIESALDIDPGNATAIRLMSEWALKDNQLERAIKLVGPYLKLNPNDALMHLLMAKFFYFYARLEESLYHVKKSLELDPSVSDASEVLDIIQVELKQRAERFK